MLALTVDLRACPRGGRTNTRRGDTDRRKDQNRDNLTKVRVFMPSTMFIYGGVRRRFRGQWNQAIDLEFANIWPTICGRKTPDSHCTVVGALQPVLSREMNRRTT